MVGKKKKIKGGGGGTEELRFAIPGNLGGELWKFHICIYEVIYSTPYILFFERDR